MKSRLKASGRVSRSKHVCYRRRCDVFPQQSRTAHKVGCAYVDAAMYRLYPANAYGVRTAWCIVVSRMCASVCVCALIIIQIKYRTAVAKSAPCGRALLRFLQHDPSIQSLGAMYFDTNYYYITVIMYTIQPEPRNPKPLTETKEGLGLFRMGTTYS